MQKPIKMRGAVFAMLVLVLCQVDGIVASSLRLRGRKLAQQPLPEPATDVADAVHSTATKTPLARWVPVEQDAFTPAIAEQLAMMYSWAPPKQSNRTIVSPTTASAYTGGDQGYLAWQREMRWGPVDVTAARDPSGIAVTVKVQVLFWSITLGSDKLTVDQPVLAFGHPGILSLKMAADFLQKTGTMTLQMARKSYRVAVR